ncbi:MAG: beta-lactamase family protein [Proteobacteria bacterium]|nr:beta-lactamase family protein [Pseudomonadota bacterium]MCP4915701.1 beta-lactamase family protein [Pseudomonadota bacterium]
MDEILLDVPLAREVTWRGDADPAASGLDPRPIEAIWREVERLYAGGLHPAIALTLRHRGKVVLDRAIGHVHVGPDRSLSRPVDDDTLFNLFSGSKLVTATLVHALIEQDALRLDAPLSTWLPELTGAPKATLRQVLSHTAGLHRMPDHGMSFAQALEDDNQLLAAGMLSPTRPGWTAYSPMVFGVLLGQLIRRVTNKDARQLAAELLPGLDMSFGTERVDDVADHLVTGPKPVPQMARIFQDTVGWSLDEAIGFSNSDAFKRAVLPASNTYTTGRQLTRFLDMLRNGGCIDGVRYLQERTVRRMLDERTRAMPDGTFGLPMRYGLGPMLGGDRMSLFGLGTRGAFGHLGLTTVVAYTDPRRELSVAFMNTGKPLLAPGFVRWYLVLQRIALAVPRTP